MTKVATTTRHALSAARNFSNAASALGKLGKLMEGDDKLVVMNEKHHALNRAAYWRRVARDLEAEHRGP